MSRINHARSLHRGKPIEICYKNPFKKPFSPAEAANAGRVLSSEERQKIATQYGYKVA